MALDAERACADGGTGPNAVVLCLIFVFAAYIFGDSALTWVVVTRNKRTTATDTEFESLPEQ